MQEGWVFARSQLRNHSVFIDFAGESRVAPLREQRQPAKNCVTLVSVVSVALRPGVIRYSFHPPARGKE